MLSSEHSIQFVNAEALTSLLNKKVPEVKPGLTEVKPVASTVG